jgi:hypothetical protein
VASTHRVSRRRYEGLSRVNGKPSRTVLRGAVGGSAARLLDPRINGQKQTRAFSLKDKSRFAFAGLWDHWEDKETGEVLESFAIVTVEPNEWMAKYHDRMGVIIELKNYQHWLEPGEEYSLPFDLLRPHPEEDMQWWRVSEKVGNWRNNWAELIEPIPDDAPKPEKRQSVVNRQRNCRQKGPSIDRASINGAPE